MRLAIEFQPGDPPSGQVTAVDGVAVPFAGWLELLRVLAELTTPLTAGQAAADGEAP